MLKITIVCVGRLKEEYWKNACREYGKRMSRFADFSIIEADEYSSIAASVSMGSGVAIMPILPILDSFNVKSIPFADSPMYRDICVLRSSSHEMSPEVQNVWELAKHISHESGNGVK